MDGTLGKQIIGGESEGRFVDISSIRVSNIRALVKRAGDVVRLVKECDLRGVRISENYLYQIIGDKPNRKPGAHFCRKLERGAGLAPGTLDQTDPRVTAAAIVMQALPDEARASVMRYITAEARSAGLIQANESVADYVHSLPRRNIRPRG